MNSPELLSADDSCRRKAFWSLSWERWSLHPVEVLRRSIDEALVAETDDCGINAGDGVMTYFSNRGVDTKKTDLYGLGVHLASMADLITTVLRGAGSRFERPADLMLGQHLWTSSAFLEPSGVRLRGITVVDRLSPERLESLKHSWKALETSIYEMPMTLSVIVLGANRDGRWHGPWSKGYLHPIGSNLRFRKQDGKALRGDGWKAVFREECDRLSRDLWLERMVEDGVMEDSLVHIDLPVPIPQVVKKVKGLALKKLERIKSSQVRPEPQPSACDWPVACGFKNVCWQFRTEPRESDGFIRLE